jgi:hypothetical protein
VVGTILRTGNVCIRGVSSSRILHRREAGKAPADGRLFIAINYHITFKIMISTLPSSLGRNTCFFGSALRMAFASTSYRPPVTKSRFLTMKEKRTQAPYKRMKPLWSFNDK